jgi:hypothetical protein
MKRVFCVFALTLCQSLPAAAQSSCPNNVTGGQNAVVVTNPRVHNFYVGSGWNSSPSYFKEVVSNYNYWAALVKDPAFWNRLSEYGVHQGSWAGISWDVGTHSSPITDSDLQTLLAKAIPGGFGLGSSRDDNDIYVIYLAPGLRADKAVANGWDGYHDHFWSDQYGNIWYAVVEYRSGADFSEIASHEVAEMVTDPNVTNGYRDYSIFEGEIGDLCNHVDFSWSENGFAQNIQMVWSQSACQCITDHVPPPPPTPPKCTLPPELAACCHKPSLPMCTNPGLPPQPTTQE